MTKRLTITEFWDIKHQIDAEVERLGWTKEQCKSHIKTVYGANSRLSMSDEDLLDLLAYLRNLHSVKIIPRVSSRKAKKRRGRRT